MFRDELDLLAEDAEAVAFDRTVDVVASTAGGLDGESLTRPKVVATDTAVRAGRTAVRRGKSGDRGVMSTSFVVRVADVTVDLVRGQATIVDAGETWSVVSVANYSETMLEIGCRKDG
ncbi:MAG: hypothetical protein AAGI53_09500 [Planctomycetota bacterium]